MSWADILGVRDGLAASFGIDWFDYQLEALDGELHTNAVEMRVCLYFRTGAGKTYTALALLKQAGEDRAVVIAPPKTHAQWKEHGDKAGIELTCISHAKYRQKGTKFPKQMAMVVDEFHMLGGQSGPGWEKLRVQSRYMLAPLIILSATPNYNDAERVYCVQHVLDPLATKGGYIAWIYQNCETEQNPFGTMPKVLGFLDSRSAREHLSDLPHVYHVEDPHADFDIGTIVLPTAAPGTLMLYGLDHRRRRICASRMELVSASRNYQLVNSQGVLRDEVYEVLAELAGNAVTPVMVFCARATIAHAAHVAAVAHGARSGVVTYDPNPKRAEATLTSFKAGELDVLFGTATMSTGVDGLDKVCDMLILLDDTDDDSLRRQVIGRILPRGSDSDVSNKVVVRLALGDS